MENISDKIENALQKTIGNLPYLLQIIAIAIIVNAIMWPVVYIILRVFHISNPWGF